MPSAFQCILNIFYHTVSFAAIIPYLITYSGTTDSFLPTNHGSLLSQCIT